MSFVVVALGVVLSLVVGCGAPSRPPRPTLHLVHSQWMDGKALALASAVVAEERLGYAVRVREAALDACLGDVVAGRADAFFSMWLPETNRTHLAEHGPGLIDLGPMFDRVQVGLVAPLDLPADSIPELEDLEDELGGEVLAIEADSGLGRSTAAALEAYGLKLKARHMPTAQMFERFGEALEAGRPVVATGWLPHWMFVRWRLKFLHDPDQRFGGIERLHVVGNPTLPTREPRAAALLRAVRFDEARLDSLLEAVHVAEGGDLREVVRQWLHTEQALVDAWVEAAEAAPDEASRSR